MSNYPSDDAIFPSCDTRFANDWADADTGERFTANGRELMDGGLRFGIDTIPGSQLFYYKEKQQ